MRFDCGNECAVIQPYGFVPECGCEQHDSKEIVDKINSEYGKHIKDGEVFVCNNIGEDS